MTAPDLLRLRELMEAATPGPWQAKNEHEWDEIIGNIDGPDAGQFHYAHVCSVDMLDVRTPEQRANAALICAAVNALPSLLARIEALEGDATRYRWLREGCGYNAAKELEGVQATHWFGDGLGQAATHEYLDELIDAARLVPVSAEGVKND